MAFCTNCGTKIEEEAMFCPSCGTRVAETPTETATTAEQATPVEQVTTEDQATTEETATTVETAMTAETATTPETAMTAKPTPTKPATTAKPATTTATPAKAKTSPAKAAKKIKYELQGGQLPVVVCELDEGDELFTESGGMSWMSDNIAMSTNMEGGLLQGLGRKLSGESFFMATYRATGGPGMIAFASSFPGSIIAKELAPGQSIICQKRSFLAAQRTVTLATHFQQNLGAGLFGGEGFIMQRITGPGIVFLEIDGAAIEYDLADGQMMKVDTGNVALLEETVKMKITTVSGFKNILFGGEGLFLTTLTGPGHIWLQSMPVENMAKSIMPFFPKK